MGRTPPQIAWLDPRARPGIPHFLRAIENKKKFAAFPWQLAWIVKLAKFMPAWLYDKTAGRARFRE